MTADPQTFMRRALELARRGEGRTRPNPPVGAVVVRGDRIVGEGYHPRAGDPHAEIFALREAGEAAQGADLYVTLEPCSHTGRTGPCTEAVIAAGVRRVVAGTRDPNPRVAGRGLERLRRAGLEVETGLLEADCRWLLAPFAKHVTTGLPHVLLKAGLTLDGRSATAGGESRWITGPASRLQVHRVRDRVDAIMVGVGTVLRDDPQLTTRLPAGGRDPLRIVVDSGLRLSAEARVVTVASEARTLVATTARAAPEKIRRLEEAGCRVLVLPEGRGGVSLPDLFRRLGDEGVQSVLVEGGRHLNSTLLGEGLIDRVMIFLAPLLLGGEDGAGLFAGPGPQALPGAVRLSGVRVSRFDDDTLIEGNVESCSQA